MTRLLGIREGKRLRANSELLDRKTVPQAVDELARGALPVSGDACPVQELHPKPLAVGSAPQGVQFRRQPTQVEVFDLLGRLRASDQLELELVHGLYDRQALARIWCKHMVDGLVVTLDGQPEVVVLAHQSLPGQWQVGMIASPQWSRVGKKLTRYLNRYLLPVLLAHRVRRISALVHAEHEEARRWLGFLGFRLEGTLARYGLDGSDFQIMTLFPDQLR